MGTSGLCLCEFSDCQVISAASPPCGDGTRQKELRSATALSDAFASSLHSNKYSHAGNECELIFGLLRIRMARLNV